jgi:hypothetical protein
MHYTTVSVDLTGGYEEQCIDGAIGQGLEALSKEINGPVELVSVVPVPIGEKLYVTVLAKPYLPVAAIAKPFMSGVLPL